MMATRLCLVATNMSSVFCDFTFKSFELAPFKPTEKLLSRSIIMPYGDIHNLQTKSRRILAYSYTAGMRDSLSPSIKLSHPYSLAGRNMLRDFTNQTIWHPNVPLHFDHASQVIKSLHNALTKGHTHTHVRAIILAQFHLLRKISISKFAQNCIPILYPIMCETKVNQ